MPVDTSWNSLRRCRATVPPHVVFRVLAHETVLLNVNSGQYHGLDRISGRFFEAIKDSPDLQAASAVLAKEYGQTTERIETDLAAFCSDLRELGLIELQPQQPQS
jgi:hypothetical protein